MKKIVIIILTLVAFKTYGQNHYLGVDAGLYFASIASKDYKPGFRTAFAGGVSYEYFFNKNVSVGAGLVYCARGFTTKNEKDSLGQDLQNGAKSKTNFNYITIPLKIGFSYGEKFFGFAKIGLVPAILIKAEEVKPGSDAAGNVIENATENLTNKVRKMDLGGVIELGGGYNVSARCKIKLSLSYQHSFSALTTENYHPKSTWRNRGVNLALGLSWALTNKPFADDSE